MNNELASVLVDAFLFKTIGGLGIFLLGMKFMSEGMQAVAGRKLRKMITLTTHNRVIGCMIGAIITSVIQSSSVTTVMVIGLVNGGFMTLMQAIGVIMGANIGTTITGWILALKIAKYGLPILGVAAFAYLFIRNERARYTAMAIMGVGMVFFGLETMSAGFKDPRIYEVLKVVFARLDAGTYKGLFICAIAGCIVTATVQSSSAVLGITIALAETKLIDFTTAAGIIIGLNIGTTITAFLASLGSNTDAKRAAYAHILFNTLGSVWLFPFFYIYTDMISTSIDFLSETTIANNHVIAKIALSHTCFNILNTIVFLPMTGLLAKIVTRIAPDKPHKEAPHLTFLDVRMLDTPSIGIQQSFVEILCMDDHIRKMMTFLRELITSKDPDEEKTKELFHREEILDVVQKEIVEFLSQILSGNIPHDVVNASRKQLRIADEYESVSDYIADLLKLRLKLHNAGLQISEDSLSDILSLHDQVSSYIDIIGSAVHDNNPDVLDKARIGGDAITSLMKDLRTKHLDKVEAQHVPPLKSLIYTDMLTSYRRIKDHILNIAECLAGEK